MKNGQKILVVDDNFGFVNKIRIKLQSLGYSVISANDGLKALEVMKKDTPDLVILDIMMPRMDGFKTLNRIKTDFTDTFIPIIMLTVKDDIKSKVKALDLGADDYLTKPFDMEELTVRVRSMIRIKDLTEELRKATEEINRTHALLSQKNKLASMGQLTAIFSHEVRSPLFGMKNSLYTLRNLLKDSDDALIFKSLEIIDQATNRIEDNINQFLEITRQGKETTEEIDLNSLIENTISLLKGVESVENVEIIKKLASDLPKLKGVVLKIQQVLLNIFMNAIQAMPDGGSLIIETYHEDGTLKIKVSDTGIGMTDEVMDKIFKPFFTTKSDKGGAGLGLVICKKIIEENGGEIECESIFGKGTTFLVTLPFDNTG